MKGPPKLKTRGYQIDFHLAKHLTWRLQMEIFFWGGEEDGDVTLYQLIVDCINLMAHCPS